MYIICKWIRHLALISKRLTMYYIVMVHPVEMIQRITATTTACAWLTEDLNIRWLVVLEIILCQYDSIRDKDECIEYWSLFRLKYRLSNNTWIYTFKCLTRFYKHIACMLSGRTTKFINKGYILEGKCDQIEILCFCWSTFTSIDSL